jgi:hypothetical protein
VIGNDRVFFLLARVGREKVCWRVHKRMVHTHVHTHTQREREREREHKYHPRVQTIIKSFFDVLLLSPNYLKCLLAFVPGVQLPLNNFCHSFLHPPRFPRKFTSIISFLFTAYP